MSTNFRTYIDELVDVFISSKIVKFTAEKIDGNLVIRHSNNPDHPEYIELDTPRGDMSILLSALKHDPDCRFRSDMHYKLYVHHITKLLKDNHNLIEDFYACDPHHGLAINIIIKLLSMTEYDLIQLFIEYSPYTLDAVYFLLPMLLPDINLKTLQFMIENFKTSTDIHFAYVSVYGSLEMLQYLMELDAKKLMTAENFIHIIRRNNFDMFKLFVENGIDFLSINCAFRIALNSANSEVVKFYLDHQYSITSDPWFDLFKSKDYTSSSKDKIFEIVKILKENCMDQELLKCAFDHTSDYQIVRYLIDNGVEWIDYQEKLLFAAIGHQEYMAYLINLGAKTTDPQLLINRIIYLGNADILKFLINNGYKEYVQICELHV